MVKKVSTNRLYWKCTAEDIRKSDFWDHDWKLIGIYQPKPRYDPETGEPLFT